MNENGDHCQQQASIQGELLDPSSLFRLFLDLLNVGVIFLDRDLHIIYMNKAKREKHSGIEPGMKWREVLPSHKERQEMAQRAIETGEVQQEPNCILVEEEGFRHVNVKITPVRNETGEIIGAIEIAYDVEDLYQSHIQLEMLNQEYEGVIYALSHDLRAPLVSIEGFLRKLSKGHIDTENEVARHCLDRIHANVKMMNDFVNVLLDTARIARGVIDLQDVPMGEIVREVIRQFTSRATEQGAQLLTVGEFPVVHCDRIRCIQLFNNLVGNALMHCKEVPDLKVEVGCQNNVFWVKDNGQGIAEDFRDKVFEPFTQGNRNGDDSFGMGMNIVYKIVQKHKGQIWIDTKPQKGTCIYFTLGQSKTS